tara:strand:- start:3990 stop:4790 length:801 start_codon:yes stop_codon:yes gene_type:complete
MNKFITNKKNNFTMIDNKLICNNKLSAKAKGILIYLLSRPKEWYASVTDITKNFKDGTDAVKSALKELEKFMYLDRTKTRKPDGTFLTIYNVYESPDQHPKKQTTLLKDAIHSGKSTVDNPLVENPQINNNTDVNNIKKLFKKEFDLWYLLYNKKTTKKQSLLYWNKKVTSFTLIETIMKHTKQYVSNTDKTYRLDPLRYLRNEKWEDEIIIKPKSQAEREQEQYKEAEATMHKKLEQQRKEWAEADKNKATDKEIKEALSGFKRR